MDEEYWNIFNTDDSFNYSLNNSYSKSPKKIKILR